MDRKKRIAVLVLVEALVLSMLASLILPYIG